MNLRGDDEVPLSTEAQESSVHVGHEALKQIADPVKMVGLDCVGKIKKLVFDSVFKRALGVASSDSLLGISFEGDDLEACNAECIGSSSTDVYKVNVNVTEDNALGKCSCPASARAKDGLCKHVIALLLRRNDRLQEKSITAIPNTARKEGELDEYPIENIGSPEEDALPSPSKIREVTYEQNVSETLTPRLAPKQSSSKRALPAWMLGVVGSAESGESSKASKSKRKAPAEKPPRAPPLPTKRARRHGQPLKVSNELDEDEGPGEIDVEEPEDEEPLVEDGENLDDSAPARKTGHLRNPMRRWSRYEKQPAGEIESNTGDENMGTRKGRNQVQNRSKSRRVVGKLVEVESDLSDKDKSSSFSRNRSGALKDVTDDDLMLLAQEHVANEKGRLDKDPELENEAIIPSEAMEVLEKQAAVKRTSKSSLNNWKDISSQVDAGAPLSIAGSLDLETLKTYAHQADSQSTGQHLEEPYYQGADVGVEAFPNLQTRSAAEGGSMTAPDADKDSIANDMLDLIFGTSLSVSVVPAKEVSPDVGGKHGNGADKLRTLQVSSFKELSPKSATQVVPAAVKETMGELLGEFKPKKKSSLRDKVKMLLD